MIKLVDYFRTTYNYTIKYPDLPCVQLGNKSLVPMECLELVPGNAIPPRKLTGPMTAAMIDESRQRPSDKAQTVQGWRRELAFENSQRLRSWGVSVAPTPVEITGRVLPPPQVAYGKGSDRVDVRSGAWVSNRRCMCSALAPHHGADQRLARMYAPLPSFTSHRTCERPSSAYPAAHSLPGPSSTSLACPTRPSRSSAKSSPST